MRILDIVKTSLTNERLSCEEDLENTINNKNLETDKRVATIKTLLRKIAIIDLSYKTFEDLMTSDEEQESNNNKQ